jgi:hypothetical protein
MITQSFLYNAIFFTFGLVLEFYFHVNPKDTGYYFFAFAAGNLAGPLLLGRLFDTVGRKKMISGTYILAVALLIITAGGLSDHGRGPAGREHAGRPGRQLLRPPRPRLQGPRDQRPARPDPAGCGAVAVAARHKATASRTGTGSAKSQPASCWRAGARA